ncbi:MAG: DUF5985 family protein [Rhizomicrobium sp.]
MISPAAFVYLLCLLTSIVCAGLLIRSYLRNRTSLLLWSAICFSLLALNNVLVSLDLFVFSGVDLTILRNASLLAALATLLYGFIWKVDR